MPVEYIVETTAKCNLYCPMCPRETHKQPKEDMTDEIFNRLVEESGKTAEHMMLLVVQERAIRFRPSSRLMERSWTTSWRRVCSNRRWSTSR